MENKKLKNNKEKNKGIPVVRFPMNIIKPIADFLSGEARRLERRKKELSQEDPFTDTSRVIDNAATDTDATEQAGHQRVTAIQSHADRRLIQIKTALARIKIGKYGICEKCGRMIDTDRLMVMPEATLCAQCAKKKEG